MDGAEENAPGSRYVPVCAIGASAGGVTALQSLFRQLPIDLGMAYVVILHLNPDEPSALSEILSICTRMPVYQVDDGPQLKPDCVYVIPPNGELVIDGDNVTVRSFTEPRGHRALIDMFFRSVAAGRGDGVAMILSGAGSDGALGVSAMKEAGGIIMVQEPAEAGFASMPQSAIATGMADFVGPIARLAERLVEIAQSKEAVRSLDMDGSANDLRRIIALLRARVGHDFSAYKRATVMRRVVRRMQVCQTMTMADYADYLLTTPEEAQNLFSDLLISVTMFFRDEAAFGALARQAIKPIIETATVEGNESIRIWVVGCATGEEAYSVAMVLHEEMARQRATIPFQIFATDLDDAALATAREGLYPHTIEADVSEERLARFFVHEGTHFRVRKELRESILFAKHSILREPPFIRLDLITCRNLLIYLERAVQAQVCSIFHYGLRPGRYLFLGSAETIDAAVDLFTPTDRHARIYSSRPLAGHLLPIMQQFAAPEQIAGMSRAAPARTERTALPAVVHVAALENNAPASVLVDDGLNILHLSPTAGRFILLPAGPVSNALPVVIRPELRLDLKLALARAFEQGKHTITLPTVVAFEQGRRRVAMQVVPLAAEAQRTPRALVFFLDGDAVGDEEDGETLFEANADDVRRLYAELKASQEALFISRSGHDASIQELRAANEELQSINEEYRSTAEELETSKEELQSINEELHTVNAELKSKLETISSAHSDLQNLTAATEIGTLFLDTELRIKMFTAQVSELFNVTRHDIGRAITDFTHHLDYHGIEEDARRVLSDLAPIERQINSTRGHSYLMRLRPYRTVEDRIDGTVVTFVDVSERARAEEALRESEARFRALATVGASSFFRMSPDWNEMRSLDGAGFLADAQEPTTSWVDTHVPSDERPRVREAIDLAIASKGSFELEHRLLDADGRVSWTVSRAIPLLNDAGEIVEWFGAASDVTARVKADQSFTRLFEASPTPILVVKPNAPRFTIAEVNNAYLASTMRTRETVVGRGIFEAYPENSDGATSEAVSILRASLERVLVSRQPDALPGLSYGIERPDGTFEQRWWNPVNSPVLDENGEVEVIIHTANDVTEEHRAEIAMRESEERYRELFERIDEGFCIIDVLFDGDQAVDYRFVAVNPSFERHTGIAAAEGRRMRDIELEHDQRWSDVYGEVALTGAPKRFEAAAGAFGDRWYNLNAFRVGDPERRRVAIVFSDVTQLQSDAAALRESEERFAQFAASSSDGLWIRDASTLSMEYTSAAIQPIYGVAPASLLGDPERWLSIIVPEDRDVALGHIKAAQNGEPVIHEFRIRRPNDGEVRWIRNTDFPIRDEHGRVQRIGGLAEDITEAKALRERQDVLTAELQHRTRNLLGVVRSMADKTARDSTDLVDFRARFRDRLEALARVQGLLSRMNSYDRIHFDELVRTELAAMDGGSDRVTLDGPEGVRLRSSTVQTLAMAMHELATNAVKYGALGQPSGRLSLSWFVEHSGQDGRPWLHIEWRESGVDMPPPDVTPRGTGQGRELIERALPYQLGACTTYELRPDGVLCTIAIPISTTNTEEALEIS